MKPTCGLAPTIGWPCSASEPALGASNVITTPGTSGSRAIARMRITICVSSRAPSVPSSSTRSMCGVSPAIDGGPTADARAMNSPDSAWFAPVYVPWIARFQGERLEEAIVMTRWLMPCILATSLSGILAAILNAYHRFTATALQGVFAKLLTIAIESAINDSDFFLRKAIGWALRDYARTNTAWVRSFAETHELSPLSRREALKHLS